MLGKDKKLFFCKLCGSTSPLKFSTSFPYYLSCNEKKSISTYWRSSWIVFTCDNPRQRIDGLFCDQCWNELEGRIILEADNATSLRVCIPSSLSKIESFRFDIPFRAMDISEVMTDHLGSLHLPWGNMLDIERLAIFADMYQVQTLSETTLLALYQRLAMASCDDNSFSTVIELAGIVYDGTPALRIDAPYE